MRTMSAQTEQVLPVQSTDPAPDSGAVVALASERARNAQRAWREAQQRRMLAAQRAEQLLMSLKATEEQAERRIAAAHAAALARRAAQQKRFEAAARAERLELELRNAAEAGERLASDRALIAQTARVTGKPAAARCAALAALGFLACAAAWTLAPLAGEYPKAPAELLASTPWAPSTATLNLRLSYRLQVRPSR